MSEAGQFTSWTDIELSEGGRRLAETWAPTFAGTDVVAFCSPMKRAVETALLAGLDAEPMDDLREWDLGEMEGHDSDQFRVDHPGWVLYTDGPWGGGGESLGEVSDRAHRVADRIASVDAECAVLVGHGQFFRVLSTCLLGLEAGAAQRLSMGAARAGVLSWRDSIDGYSLGGWNRTPAPLSELLDGNA